jgi:hypothetical protein
MRDRRIHNAGRSNRLVPGMRRRSAIVKDDVEWSFAVFRNQ